CIHRWVEFFKLFIYLLIAFGNDNMNYSRLTCSTIGTIICTRLVIGGVEPEVSIAIICPRISLFNRLARLISVFIDSEHFKIIFRYQNRINCFHYSLLRIVQVNLNCTLLLESFGRGGLNLSFILTVPAPVPLPVGMPQAPIG